MRPVSGGPKTAAQAVLDRFGEIWPAFDLRSTIWPRTSQVLRPRAYAQQTGIDHPEVSRITALADAVTAVESIGGRLKAGG